MSNPTLLGTFATRADAEACLDYLCGGLPPDTRLRQDIRICRHGRKWLMVPEVSLAWGTTIAEVRAFAAGIAHARKYG